MCSLLVFSVLLWSLATMAYARAARETHVILCTDEDEPVCGLDLQTYRNRCVLKQQHRGNDDIAYTSACRPEAPCPIQVLCLTNFQPVCGTDGVTYRNSCVMFQQNCHEVTTAYNGEC